MKKERYRNSVETIAQSDRVDKVTEDGEVEKSISV